MIKILIFLLFLMSTAFAGTGVNIQDANGNYQGSSSNPLIVHCVSGCSGGGGTAGLWETNSIGIDTFSPAVGIGSTNPGTALDVNGTTRTVGFSMGGNTTTLITGTGANVFATSPTLTTPNLGTPSAINLGNATGTATNVSVGTTNALNSATTIVNVSSATAPSNGQVLTATGATAATWQTPSASTSYWINAPNVGIGTAYNVGVGSLNPGQALDVQGYGRFSSGIITGAGSSYIVGMSNGNVGINTTNTGNVGIGTMWPGVALDVNGTVRMTGITITTGVLANGNVLVANNVGIGSWMPPSTIGASGGGSGTVNSGTINQFAYYASSTTAVSTQTPLSTDNTNIGVGTTGPSSLFDVNRKFNVLSNGNVGIGSFAPTSALIVIGGNVGIGSNTPGTALDVNGTFRGIGAIFTGNLPSTFGNNVGIGTFTTNQLTVNGGVSIDTANGQYVQTVAPAGGMLIHGNVGIGTGMASPPTLLSIGGKCLGLAGDMYLNASGSVCVCTSGSFPACASSVCC